MTDTAPIPEPSIEAARAYRDAMGEFERRMEEVDVTTQSISRRTHLIIRVVAWMTVLSTLYLGYTVYVLGGDVKRLAGSMVEMYQHLGTMADDVSDMRQSVIGMGTSMEKMPTIAGDVGSMSTTLNHMGGRVGEMDATLEGLDREVASITRNTQRMNGEMARMTHGVDHMRYNIGEMARPLP